MMHWRLGALRGRFGVRIVRDLLGDSIRLLRERRCDRIHAKLIRVCRQWNVFELGYRLANLI